MAARRATHACRGPCIAARVCMHDHAPCMRMRSHRRPKESPPELGGQLVHLCPRGGATLLDLDLLKLVLAARREWQGVGAVLFAAEGGEGGLGSGAAEHPWPGGTGTWPARPQGEGSNKPSRSNNPRGSPPPGPRAAQSIEDLRRGLGALLGLRYEVLEARGGRHLHGRVGRCAAHGDDRGGAAPSLGCVAQAGTGGCIQHHCEDRRAIEEQGSTARVCFTAAEGASTAAFVRCENFYWACTLLLWLELTDADASIE
jgi:hypothetical protein